MKNPLLILAFAAMAMFSCNSLIKYDVLIDNPEYDDLVVTIGDEVYNVDGYGSLEIEITRGEHQVVATNESGDDIFDEVVNVTKDGVINPTGATYVKWSDLYLEDLNDYDYWASSALDMEDVVMVNGKEYNEVDFVVYENQSFIEEDWDYGLNEYWPDEVSISSDYAVKSKMYRVDKLEEDWGYYGDYDFSDYTEEDFDSLLDSLEQMLEGMDIDEVTAE